MAKKIIVIGGGFSGLSAATHLAVEGHEVTLLEKNHTPGGRARKFDAEGFVFDMGPSWYWMPDVFDDYFARFGKKPSDYYHLKRLNPSYVVHFKDGDVLEVPSRLEELYALFESYELGSSVKLKKFLEEAQYKYEVGMRDFVERPGHSIMEFADIRVVRSLFRLQMFQSISSHVRKLFKNPKLVELLEFPVLFLGATPENTPALYSLMNYADLALGTWYPMGGMHKIIEGMVQLAEEKGVQIVCDAEVEEFEMEGKSIVGVKSQKGDFEADIVIGSGDYQHIEQNILPKKFRQYSSKYWESRVMAPSSLLFYIGINSKIEGLAHHNLFFDADFSVHAEEIYENPKWPTDPLFYVCAPSITDDTVAPKGKENLFLLIPLAPGLEDSRELREEYYQKVMERLENKLGQVIRGKEVYKKSYAMDNFKNDYHAFKGNAYGLANTLLQTAFLKPKMKSKKVKNLFYTGQLTTPGPGVPPSLISGRVVAGEVQKQIVNIP
jgi:phytoene desaturase